jgi:hypothetical protein
MVGGGALDAASEVQELARLLQAPVTAHRSGKGVMPEDDDLALLPSAAWKFWPRCDLLIGIGSRLELQHLRWRWFPDGQKTLRIDIDPTEFVRLKPDLGIVADAAEGTRALLDAFPYRQHTVLTDPMGLWGVQFCHPPRYRDGPTAGFAGHLFDRICAEHGIEQRLTKPNHPWTNGQVERMNRTIKDATVKRYHYADHDQLRQHLQLFIDAYNHAKRLKTLRGLTPYAFVIPQWTKEPM